MTTKPTELRRRGIGVIFDLFPFVWTYKKRVIFAFVSLILAKLAVVATPIYLKDIINELSVPPSAMVFPLAALIGYGFMRIAGSLFQELRDAIFSRVTQGSIKEIAVAVFKHLFGLSMRFHLQRQTGGLSRDIERGTKSIGYMLNFILFRIIPTLLELLMVMGVLLYLYDLWFTVVTLLTIAVYVIFTFAVTERRLVTRRQMNTLDSMANSKAIDALMNYETVKYFDNEGYEINRYQENMQGWVNSSVKNQVSLNFLNAGQSIIITLGTLTLLWMAALRVYVGEMSVGDVVLVSTYLTQLYVPLTMLGFIYREMKNALADIERMFNLFKEQCEVADRPDAIELSTRNPSIEFKNVDFAYEAERQILKNLSFNLEAGKTLAVVGTSGAGKSTLARLLFRFYDVTGGQILIDGVDIRDYTQSSLRRHIGIVPQDTVLFNDTIFYNIAYGNTTASADEVS
ncbi:ATM1-type heavy metal exporter [Oligella sp. MSHR50489EDL]